MKSCSSPWPVSCHHLVIRVKYGLREEEERFNYTEVIELRKMMFLFYLYLLYMMPYNVRKMVIV